MAKKQSVAKQSPSIVEEQLAGLRELMPHVFSEGKIDFEKLNATLGDFGNENPERYSFSWAGKRDAIRILQTPSRATLVPAHKESVEFDKTKNIFIEGDNLEVLKLIYKPYFGQVKMIYIDPPYNTGNDFVYPDNFTDPLDTYLKITGQKDSEGNLLTSNAETNGRYHSAWLSMMYPRLFLARQLLSDDGVIFVSIDDNEVHNLRLLMNEIFGEENFISDIVAVNNLKGRNERKFIATAHERLLMYIKTNFQEAGLDLPEERIKEYSEIDSDGYQYRLLGLRKRGGADTRALRPKLFYPIYVNPQNGKISLEPEKNFVEVLPYKSDGTEGRWRWSSKKVKDNVDILVGKTVGTKNRFDIFEIDYLDKDGESKKLKPKSVWFGTDVSTDSATKTYRKLMDKVDFKNPKPVPFIKDLIKYATDEEDIILDFFAGSATTGHAVLELNRDDEYNRRFILIQLPEPLDSEEPAAKLGFQTIADISKERIRRAINKMKEDREGQFQLNKPEDLGFKVFKLHESNYRQWDETEQKDPKVYAKQMEMLQDPLVKGWKDENVIYEVALKEGYGLNIQIEDTKVKVVQKVVDAENEQSFYISLADTVKLKDLKPLELKKEDLFICRDIALDDETAANLSLQCKLKTI
ncbi:MAG: hypothetical protein KF758_12350 [Anaerolineales bacterium]|nr:hypothetical protein [Anaerolineales bacterium]